MDAIVADVDAALKRWRDVTEPLDHKSIDQDALTIASQSRFLSRSLSPSKRSAQIDAPHCRAWSHADFLQRVASFSVATWFAKPARISPLECARYGWKNSAPDMLQCQSCQRLLCCKIDARLSAEGVETVAKRFAEELDTSHDDTCPWRGNPSPVSFAVLPVLVPSQASGDVVKRVGEALAKLRSSGLEAQLKAVALKEESVREVIAASQLGSQEAWLKQWQSQCPGESDGQLLSTVATLVVCGWIVSTTTPSLYCEYCNRHHSLAQQAVSSPSTVDEAADTPPRKRSKPNQTISLVDPVGDHRWFCPWIIPQNRGADAHSSNTTSFIDLPGWQQFATAINHLPPSAASDASYQTPGDALASVQSVLSLPACPM